MSKHFVASREQLIDLLKVKTPKELEEFGIQKHDIKNAKHYFNVGAVDYGGTPGRPRKVYKVTPISFHKNERAITTELKWLGKRDATLFRWLETIAHTERRTMEEQIKTYLEMAMCPEMFQIQKGLLPNEKDNNDSG